MAGTIYSLALSQQLDINGNPLSGCLLYLYDAGTSTPVLSYSDFGLTLLTSNPLEADSAGRIPPFWLDDGFYRARLTTAGGTEVFDYDNVPAVGASTTVSGGGGGSAVDATAIFATGDVRWLPAKTTATGWVRLNGLTIGSASSGATERANADVEELYIYNWNAFSNTVCPVSGGRGATGLADFNANKAMTLIDMRAAAAFGLNDMGNSNGGWLTNGTSGGGSGGENVKTILQANLPNVNLNLSLSNATNIVTATQFADDVVQSGGTADNVPRNASGVTISGTAALGGSGTAMDIMPFYTVGTWLQKLAIPLILGATLLGMGGNGIV